MDLFSGGDPPLEPPLVVGGGWFFLELKGVVHDYTYKITSLLLHYFFLSHSSESQGGGEHWATPEGGSRLIFSAVKGG